jgi:release factor glutamine methyltransferase
MAKVINTDPIHLYTDLDRPASAQERAALRQLVERAAKHEPVQYLLGEGGFLGRLFEVGPGVLVPRTATETLVQHVLTWHRGLVPEDRPDPLHIADIGTGSGCIGITLAMHLETAMVIGVDCDETAVAVAGRNAARHHLADRVSIVQGDLCDPLVAPVHVLVSNPPYIDDAHWSAMKPNVRTFEPSIALRGGPDGLDVVRRLIDQAPQHVLPGGLLVVETDDHHAAAARDLVAGTGEFEDCRVLRDEFGDDRFVTASRCGQAVRPDASTCKA